MIGGRSVGVLLCGFAVLLAALAVTSGRQGVTRLMGRSDDAEGAAHAARAFAEAYGTYDARAPDTYRERLLELTTGPLREAVVRMEPDPAAVAQARTLSTRVVAVHIASLARNRVTADVVVEQRRHATDPATGGSWEDRVHGRLTCRLVRQTGRWLVAEVRLVPIESPPQTQN
jgi:hypothetical protein